RQVLRVSAAGRISRLRAQGHHRGAPAQAFAGRHLDADRQWQDHRAHGALRAQGDGHPQRSEDLGRRRARVSRRMRTARSPQKAWFCVCTGHVIDGIKSVAEKYPGLENFMIHWAEGMPPKEFKEQLTWFAKDVMPAFKRA